MPIYEYECTTNHHRFEKMQAMTAAPLLVCEVCGAPVRKVYHPAGIIFKGSGWYKTDSRPASSSSDGSATKSEASTSQSEVSTTKGEASSTKTDSSAAKSEASGAKTDSSTTKRDSSGAKGASSPTPNTSRTKPKSDS